MIIGHQKQWRFLKKSLEMDKLSHVYLFCGQEKLGKKTFALEFLKLINSQRSLGNGHPDLVLIEPEGSTIQIAQIRELSRRMSLKPHSTTFKTAIIDRAHCLNQEAQNCFLKILEEPKGRTLLILITEMPELLFPTILSRVQKIKFFPVKKNEIKGHLKKQGVKDTEAEEISELSLGKPGLAMDFISDPEILKKQKKTIKELIAISKADLSFRFQYAKDLSADGNIKETLDIWLRYFREALISGISRNQKVCKFKNIIEQIEKTNFLISTTNVNSKLALEALMLEF